MPRPRLPHLAALALSALVALVLVVGPASAVKRGDFKTCEQSGFCKRNRAFADRAAEHSKEWSSPYAIDKPAFADGSFTAGIANALFPDVHFRLELRFHRDGVARIIMDEVDGLRQRYNEAAAWAVQTTPALATDDGEFQVAISRDVSSITYAGGKHEVRIEHQPVKVTFLRDGQPHIVLNERGLLNMEHFRVKSIPKDGDEEVIIQDPEHPEQATVIVKEDAYPGFLPPNEDGMWEETFGGKLDTKPKGESIIIRNKARADSLFSGPESLSLDITFPGYEHVYGIPQHASSLSLKQTRSVLSSKRMFRKTDSPFPVAEREPIPTRTGSTTSTSSSTMRTPRWPSCGLTYVFGLSMLTSTSF